MTDNISYENIVEAYQKMKKLGWIRFPSPKPKPWRVS